MYLKDVAEIISTFGTRPMHRKIIVNATNGDHTMSKQIWSGNAENLIDFCNTDGNGDWIAVGVIDHMVNKPNTGIMLYSGEQIITVIKKTKE